MQAFKLFFKLLNGHKGIVIQYFMIFLTLALIMTFITATDSSEEFESAKLDIAVIDKDGKTVGEALKKYFEDTHNLEAVEYDEEAILEELYWRRLDYVLVIPEGFEESLLSSDEEKIDLECMKVPGLFESAYFESELELYTAKLAGLLKAGYTIEEGEQELLSLKKEKTRVTKASFVSENQNDACTIFFHYAPYLFITLAINGVGIILLCINQEEVKARVECGALSLKNRIAGLSAAILLFGFILLAVVLVIAGFLSGGSIYTDVRFPYFLLNLFAMLLFGLSLGFLSGFVAKNMEAMSGIVNVISLSLSFLGGIFVPLDFFSDEILMVAKFTPTYWYVKNNEAIGAMKEMSESLATDIFPQMGVVAAYAVVIFAVTLVVISNKRRRSV